MRIATRPALKAAAQLLISSAVVGGIAWLYFGSFAATWAYLRGDDLSISPEVIDLGRLTTFGNHEVTFVATNRSSRPITILGGTSTCSCVATQGLPVEVAGGESIELHATIGVTEHQFDQQLSYFSDAAGAAVVEVHVRAKVD